ncbi:protein De3 [Common bottlenose dolphin gammaherpesvirus 1 strain Sarasota]|uniref:Protein De3 n=1 Tax=Common bottlenose dolphin gammaherpesvirus 1 strain Sarasota TaxID=2022783 RepID=A0A1Z1NE83_9GAMA|nr:protein De3 [Common bottlenose dolphin gammaherpesvirus 1 strain Sarasota]ARW78069.1 protein De3 [Common bottlenose dolphin gammaherpesvirus 1 strain Sarasota]
MQPRAQASDIALDVHRTGPFGGILLVLKGVLVVVCIFCLCFFLQDLTVRHVTAQMRARDSWREPSDKCRPSELDNYKNIAMILSIRASVEGKAAPMQPWPHGHVTGNYVAHPATPETQIKLGVKLTSWEVFRPGFAEMEGVGFRNGSFVILTPGFYYVYAQTYFRFSPEDDPEKQTVQYIYRQTNYPELLLLMKNARNGPDFGDYHLRTQFQGAVVKLKAGDLIFVAVNNAAKLSNEPSATFFGLFKVA